MRLLRVGLASADGAEMKVCEYVEDEGWRRSQEARWTWRMVT
jgi:hypothetical protein